MRNPVTAAHTPTHARAGAAAPRLEKVWVVAALAQLHHHVEQPRAVGAAVERLDVLLEERGVPGGVSGGD